MSKKYDQLTKDAMAAQAAGMSYGRYMATKPQAEPAVRFPKKTKGEKVRRCRVCGMPIPADCKSNHYCSLECAEKEREKTEPAPEENLLVCKQCGKRFTPRGNRKTYCGIECSELGRIAQHKAAEQRRRRERQAAEKEMEEIAEANRAI